jgi:hypothetical protein
LLKFWTNSGAGEHRSTGFSLGFSAADDRVCSWTGFCKGIQHLVDFKDVSRTMCAKCEFSRRRLDVFEKASCHRAAKAQCKDRLPACLLAQRLERCLKGRLLISSEILARYLQDTGCKPMGRKRSDSRRFVLWSGETSWKPILHCTSATLRWGRGHAGRRSYPNAALCSVVRPHLWRSPPKQCPQFGPDRSGCSSDRQSEKCHGPDTERCGEISALAEYIG